MLTHSTEAEKAKRADYMRAYERARGAIPVKGVVIQCDRCGCQTEKQHFSHSWCAACVKPAQLERRRAKRAASGTVSLGTCLNCKNCGAACIKEHKRQFYCTACMALAATNSIPAYRPVQSRYQSARNKALRQTSPSFAIRERVTAQIGNSMREKKAGRSWEALVGYTLADLMAHLGRQFVKGMSWENRSEWHIDHIVPLSSFDFALGDSEIKRAWTLSNLRPMWAVENIRKSGKRTHLC